VIRRGRVFRGVGVVALVAALAACSSSSKSSSSSTTSTSQSTSGTSTGVTSTSGSTAAQAAGAPIKVGLVCECSGPFVGGAAVPGEDVYKAFVNTVNASGGINGHPIQLITKDDTNNPGTSVTDIQALLAAHVDAIVSVTSADELWASTVQAAGIPVIGVQDTNAPFNTNPDFYPEGETAANENVAYVGVIKASGATNFGVIYCVESPQCSESVAQLKPLGQKHGTPLIYSAGIAYNAPNFTAQCLAAQQAHVQALIIEDISSVLQKVGTDCDKQGYDPIFVTGGGSYSPALATTPGFKSNSWYWYSNVPYWANTPATQAMTSALDKYYPGLTRDTVLWNQSGANAWPSGVLLEHAVKAGGLGPSDTPSAAEIVKGLNSLQGDNLDGWYAPMTFVAGQAHPQNCWYTVHVQNGTPQLVNNGQVTCQTS